MARRISICGHKGCLRVLGPKNTSRVCLLHSHGPACVCRQCSRVASSRDGETAQRKPAQRKVTLPTPPWETCES